jgi:hypothetical protein
MHMIVMRAVCNAINISPVMRRNDVNVCNLVSSAVSRAPLCISLRDGDRFE